MIRPHSIVEREVSSSERIEVLTQILRCNQENSAQSQRTRIDEAIRQLGSITTIEARKYLDVMSPATRVFELKQAGRPITTQRVKQATDCGKMHTVGLYVLEATNGY